ncbi:MAG TPA: ABC transporter permease [Candidatus Ornithomonoglobus intestinigallinarum]|uniref:Transport permease protein n=1 Tax=Candidatus Ornithomonoglobus intestinigallinarum TaxID=2840894 RepID=A0A9D1KQF1_9FIRM|nr:ABC transporter permease [Candidatus Ornithomonoglobus intestinigallinarum]
MFLKRNFTSSYKQTILGPLWFLIRPLMTSSMFTVVFGQIARISTDGVPQFLFYMAGNTAWSYFSACLTSTSSTFTGNAGLFGKVYFPRLISPITTVIFALLSFFIQVVLMIILMAFFTFVRGEAVYPNKWLLLVPLMVLQMAMLGLGLGIIISSLTTKYRDLSILVSFGVSLWMYATPIVYPMSQVPEFLHDIIKLNPMAPIVNNFRYAFLGCGTPEITSWLTSMAVTVVFLFFGVILFSRVEKTFLDTV